MVTANIEWRVQLPNQTGIQGGIPATSQILKKNKKHKPCYIRVMLLAMVDYNLVYNFVLYFSR